MDDIEDPATVEDITTTINNSNRNNNDNINEYGAIYSAYFFSSGLHRHIAIRGCE